LFGKMRTGVYLESLSEENILNAIQSGKNIVTDGPAVNLYVGGSTNHISSIGETIVGTNHSVSLEIKSTSEYGSIDSIKVFMGITGADELIVFSEKLFQEHHVTRKLLIETDKASYIRAEVWTSFSDSIDGKPHFCLTNPVWFVPV
jgi:hypothetical protein